MVTGPLTRRLCRIGTVNGFFVNAGPDEPQPPGGRLLKAANFFGGIALTDC